LQNTGGAGVRPHPSGPVRSISINDILQRLGYVMLLKLDCEGSEWSILHNLREWRRLGAICGEFHLVQKEPNISPAALQKLLQRHFRFVAVFPDTKDELGKFWASHIKNFFTNAHARRYSMPGRLRSSTAGL
jgi:hypothetical protein